ncbi:hypothetical protein PTSG_04164 [Salpingoeca rosetta]|uniref:Cyclin-F n=1 Tax=Salpingoeca rosetta (strain ATCC 50818 / BSB-021) TaxID=946362 RepID=F2U6S7_SALR5|nr:uncharacterized protein PTSG_04164 [Salpingoeca rosetta]EGD83559.1 hypothetical protein PTSG_04164 [Salpingoeca rosetta]|eukprot:XP_004995063.1 hypothetical protein PTSG_04164 [Salpingoeca rosetta]
MDTDQASHHGTVPEGFFTNMPDELTSNILAFLDMKDLCQVAQTCRKMNELAYTRSVLSKVSFEGLWPTKDTADAFARAADAGNNEAALKYGIACLYGKRVDSDATTALKYLLQAEKLCAGTTPFVWLLFRPPWTNDTCSKACVFQQMHAMAEDPSTDPHLAGRMYYCVAKTLELHEERDEREVVEALQKAELMHCADAVHDLFVKDPTAYNDDEEHSFTREKRLLQAARECPRLRFAAIRHFTRAREMYEPKKRELFRETVELGMEKLRLRSDAPPPAQPELDSQGKMRFILVDWLLEVASLKMYSIDTLHCAVDMVDRYLATRTITRRTLQLLGITCMVIAARFLEQDVVTIREAAWLTENTYDYEDVVQMVAAVLAVADGHVRRPSPNDYITIFAELSNVPVHIRCFMDYVSESCLLHQPTLTHAPAALGAAIYFVSMHLVGCKSAWPSSLTSNSDLRVSHFQEEIMEVFRCLFVREKITDHRGLELRAVEDRYTRALERGNMLHLRFTLESQTSDNLQKTIDRHIMEERRMIRSSAQTPTPPLSKMTSLPLHEITNVPARPPKPQFSP